jgi:hypothetical protein
MSARFEGASTMEGNTALRWVRALTLASVMLGSGLAGHAAAGGSVPATSMLLPVFVLFTAAIAPLSGRPRLDPYASPRCSSSASFRPRPPAGARRFQWQSTPVATRSAMHTGAAGEPVTAHLGHAVASAPTGAVAALLTGPHLGMLLAHLAAALVVGLWLAAGERGRVDPVSLAALRWSTPGSRSGSCPAPLRSRCHHCDRSVSGLVPARAGLRPALWAGRGVSRRGPPRVLAA